MAYRYLTDTNRRASERKGGLGGWQRGGGTRTDGELHANEMKLTREPTN